MREITVKPYPVVDDESQDSCLGSNASVSEEWTWSTPTAEQVDEVLEPSLQASLCASFSY